MQYLCLFILVTRACLHVCLLCTMSIGNVAAKSVDAHGCCWEMGVLYIVFRKDWEVVHHLANYILACTGIATMLCTPTVYHHKLSCLDVIAGFS